MHTRDVAEAVGRRVPAHGSERVRRGAWLLAAVMTAGCHAHASSRIASPAGPSTPPAAVATSTPDETTVDEAALRADEEVEPVAPLDPAEAIAAEDARLRSLAADPTSVAAGRATFVSTCAACHREDAGGIVGPNLTDDFVMHGASPSDVRRVVAEGIPWRGMPGWGPVIPDRVDLVVAYLLTIHGTRVAGRPPQGRRERPGASGAVHAAP